MREKLQEYALFAEIISGLAVLITLVILVLQIRENTDVVRVSAFQDVISGLNEWRKEVSSDPLKTALFNDVAFNKKIPEQGSNEYVVLQMTLENLYSNWETAYFAYQSGIIDNPQWSRVERNICLGNELFLWEDSLKNNIYLRLTDNFISFIEEPSC